ncbi:MAG: HEAT repeat domain-containing protein [Pirellulales bacterium]|nr:HEAT repeat domain-containing protein [Pirellulales bacterium]
MNAWQSPRLILMLGATCLFIESVRADVYELATGGEVRGQLMNPDDKPRQTYQIETPSGSLVTLAADQVRRIIEQSEELEEYERLAVTTPDTADGHWQLAGWCLEKKLLRERKHHLERVIELDPEHAEARRFLGYQHVRNAWMSREEQMQLRGFVYYEGDWRTPQDVEIRKRQQETSAAESEWRIKVKRWRNWLSGRNTSRVEEARKNFLDVNDPLAVPAIVDLLRKEKAYDTQLLLLEALSDIRHPLVIDTLATHALEHTDNEIRQRCIEYLKQFDDPSLVLRFTPALKSSKNIDVNRAAVILESLGFPEAIGPLIEALLTKHKVINPNAGRTSASFRPGGGGSGFSTGGSPYISMQMKNQPVLNALIKLSGGQVFEFDQPAWRQWYALSRRAGNVDLRRDESG